jgi:hypothetical protein
MQTITVSVHKFKTMVQSLVQTCGVFPMDDADQ